MARDPKTAEDIDKAINFFTEAICSSSSSFQQNDKGAAKIHAARGNSKNCLNFNHNPCSPIPFINLNLGHALMQNG